MTRFIATLVCVLANIMWAGVRDYGARGDGQHDDTLGLQAAIADADYELVIAPGTYLLSRPLVVPSGFTLRGAGVGTVLKKRTPYAHVLVNDAASSHGCTSSHDITIADLTIDCNGLSGTAGQADVTANGTIQLAYATGIRLSNIRMTNNRAPFYHIHLQSVTNFTARDLSIHGEYDGVHIGPGCRQVGVRDSYIWVTANSDAIAIMPQDYPRVQHRCDDIVGVTLENVTIDGPGAGNIAFYVGSWGNWRSNELYMVGNQVVSFGNIYKMVNATTNLSIKAPKHTMGDYTGADQITWRWLQSGTNTTSNVRSVSIINCRRTDGEVRLSAYPNTPGYNFNVAPGTEGEASVSLMLWDVRLWLTNWQDCGANNVMRYLDGR